MAENDTGGKCKSLYVHIPFCVSKCRYCDFYSITKFSNKQIDEYIDALLLEFDIHYRAGHFADGLDTLYFGGGTPTCIGPEKLGKIIETILGRCGRVGELTVEANPCTVDKELASAMAFAGVNRVILGAQSFDPSRLRILGRTHEPNQVLASFEAFRSVGIENLGLDLISAVPNVELEGWDMDLQEALSLNPAHISIYMLTLEPGTPLYEEMEHGGIREICDETQRGLYYQFVEKLVSEGYIHYEVSNFSRPGYYSRHNMVYWHNEDCIGLGPSAAGYFNGVRQKNHPDINSYIEALKAGNAAPSVSESLSGMNAVAEELMLSLRLIEGVDIERFVARFGGTPQELFPQTTRCYLDEGALEITASHLRIAHDSIFTSNMIIADYIAEGQRQ